MWFPKSAWQWALVVGVPFVLSWVVFGIAAAFIITVVLVGGYCGVYGLKTQKKPEDQNAVIPDTNFTIQPDGQAVGQGMTGAPPKAKAVAVAPPKKSDFAVPNYDVPHVNFSRTPEGFTVSFNKAKIGIHRGISNVSKMKHGTGLAGVGSGVGALAGLAVIGAVRLAQNGSNIEVNREAVIVDGKKMSRRDFGGFHISHSWQGAHLEGSLVVLGYTFGSQSFEFGGGWDERKGTEVAAALNRHLRDTPMIGDETVASPEFLREARPSDF
jgi:hypothetical protein